MLLIDLNQVLISGIMGQINNNKDTELSEDLLRHMVLNTIRFHVNNHKKQYGPEVVLCCDNRKYWRRDFFPHYKANRKKSREKSDLDWHLIFDLLAKFKQELKENFHYKVVDVEGAEADDVIAVLTTSNIKKQNVLIVSSDGDFMQLQQLNSNSKYKVKQYNPIMKKYVTSENPQAELKEKIIRGDKGDGIPNIFSPADTFINESRQKQISKGTLEKLMGEDCEKWEDQSARDGFVRNQTLIDLRHIPVSITQAIINNYETLQVAPRSKMLNYFVEHKLKNLMEVIEEF